MIDLVLAMPSPFKHSKTGVYWFRQRVPADIRRLAKGKTAYIEIGTRNARYTIGDELKVSLGTKDPREARDLASKVDSQFRQLWETFRKGPAKLSFKNVVALSGELYRDTVRRHEDNPGSASVWEFMDTFTANLMDLAKTDAVAARDLLVKFAQDLGISLPDGPLISADLRRILQTREVALADEDRLELLRQAIQAQRASYRRLAINAAGDYSPDPTASQFPNFQPVKAPDKTTATPALSLFELLDHKARTRTLRPKTVADYRRLLNEFVTFVGHDDAQRLGKADIRRWRDKLIEVKAPKKTVNDRYLAALKSVLAHGVKEFDLHSNVADGIRDEREDAAPTGAKDYTLDQARTILAATFRGTTKALDIPYQRALFWVPWLCVLISAEN